MCQRCEEAEHEPFSGRLEEGGEHCRAEPCKCSLTFYVTLFRSRVVEAGCTSTLKSMETGLLWISPSSAGTTTPSVCPGLVIPGPGNVVGF